MLRAVLAVVGIAAVSVTLLDGIKPCCTSANAQTQTASPEPTIWDHNGSVMYLVENGSSREFHYQKPRPGMLEAGVRPGSLLFRGQVDNGQYSGTAFIFGSDALLMTASRITQSRAIVLREGRFSLGHTFVV